MKKIFRKDLRPACDYCVHGRPAPDANAILCVKHGIMDPGSSCHSFRYDPLKRTPKPKAKIHTEFKPEDFEL